MTVKYYDLKNKKVFITGGGSGIGASIVKHFCEQESEVFFVDLNEEASNQLIAESVSYTHLTLPTICSV